MASTGPYSGRIVVRLLPEHVNVDYEQAKQSLPSIEPPSVRPLPKPSELGVGSMPRPDPALIQAFNLQDCANVVLDIYFVEPKSGREEHIHLNRSATETVQKALQRIALSLSKKLLKRQKGTKKKVECEVSLRKPDGSFLAVGDETHQQVWIEALLLEGGLVLDVVIDDVNLRLPMEFCPPTLISVKIFEAFGSRLFVGIPLVLQFETIFSSKTIVDWYAGSERVLANSRSYTPKAADIGKPIAVVIQPTQDGYDGKRQNEAFRFKHTVEERPGNDILDIRSSFTEPRHNHGNLRVLSYNILADMNAFSVLAQTSFYPYCDSSLIVKERRLPLVLFEILQFSADLICLQEVDHFAFHDLLQPVLKSHGYQGYYSCKQGTREGLAMFWSLKVFEKVPEVEMKSYAIRDLFDDEKPVGDWTSMTNVFDLLSYHHELNSILREKLGHVLQTVTLTRRCHNLQKVTVGNTHLFFHPMACHVRLLQLFACFRQMDVEREGHHPIVFCGDLNSSPTSGAARLFLDRKVDSANGMTDQGPTWRNLHTFSWERDYIDPADVPSDAVDPPFIELPESFPNLISGYSELSAYTHYIEKFAATLDYVLVSEDSFEPVSTAEMPSEEVLTRNVAMPSDVIPSDHVSLVCDVAWIHRSGSRQA